MKAKAGQLFRGTKEQYTLLDLIGEGGNGKVWKARSGSGDVAIKLLHRTGAEPSARFKREVSVLEQLKDVPGVLPLLDTPDPGSNGQPWFVMPIALPLQKRLGTQTGLKEICIVGAEVARTLDTVHMRGFSHRDIKPENLFWYGEQWCLGDFGLVELPDIETITEGGKKLGSAYYIAPEMLNDARNSDGKYADIFSFGKTLWVLATGQRYPLPGQHTPAWVGASIGSYRTDPCSVLLDELLFRMTEHDPNGRPSAAEVAKELSVLTTDKATDTPQDRSAALTRLRAAVLPHQNRDQERVRQVQMANRSFWKMMSAIKEIADQIERESDLKPDDRYQIPQSQYMDRQTPNLYWGDGRGFCFEAGGERVRWRLGFGVQCALKSNLELVADVGYSVWEVINGKRAETPIEHLCWHSRGEAPNGSPSSDSLCDGLILELRSEIPTMLDQFTRLF